MHRKEILNFYSSPDMSLIKSGRFNLTYLVARMGEIGIFKNVFSEKLSGKELEI